MEYYEAERKKELLPFTTAWMELERIMLSEISQVVKIIPYGLTYNRNLMNKTNKQNRTRGMATRNKMTETRENRGGR